MCLYKREKKRKVHHKNEISFLITLYTLSVIELTKLKTVLGNIKQNLQIGVEGVPVKKLD